MVAHAATSPVFRAVSDPTRRAMLDLLEVGTRTVSELVAAFSISQPAISKHLRVLREAGLVVARRDGRLRRYDIDPAPLRELDAWIERYRHFWTDKLDALGTYLDNTEPEEGS